MREDKLHGVLGSNIKIHFAGAENVDFGLLLHDAGVNYFLFTVLPFIMNQFNIKWGRITLAKHLFPQFELPKIAKHVIMDSGLFSLMFGACKDVRPDEKMVRAWKDAIVEFVHQNKAYSLTCVECDCQKLLGVDLAWELRQQMRNQIPNRIINVFHFEDGQKGLDRMIEFAEYIAISVPEQRIVKPATYKEDVYRLASYIKNRKPSIDIHLLGCTEVSILKKCRFCTSADSTSWQSINRYGNFGKFKADNFKSNVREEAVKHTLNVIKKMGIETTEKRTLYLSNFWLATRLLLQRYTIAAGDQT